MKHLIRIILDHSQHGKGDLDARIVVIGQDWGDEDSYVSSEGRCEPSNSTNRKLVEHASIHWNFDRER